MAPLHKVRSMVLISNKKIIGGHMSKKLMCRRCENEEITEEQNFCQICGLNLKAEREQQVKKSNHSKTNK